MTASVGPGVRGNELLEQLAAHDLFFPAGHCPGVGLGGYLLQGGYGWNGRVHGPACMSVEAIDVVTADGELVRADAREPRRPALGGARLGPGLLRRRHALPPAPPAAAAGRRQRRAPLRARRCSRRSSPGPPRSGRRCRATMELMLFVHRDAAGRAGDRGDRAGAGRQRGRGARGARAARDLPGGGPREGRGALRARRRWPISTPRSTPSYPDDHRYAVDNMWTHAPVAELLPGLRRDRRDAAAGALAHAVDELGPARRPRRAPGHGLQRRGRDLHRALRGLAATRRTTPRTSPGPTDNMRAMEALATGIQLADENLGRRPARFLSDANLARLDALRAALRPGRPVPSAGWAGREAAATGRGPALADAAAMRPLDARRPPRRPRGDRRAARSTPPTRCRREELDRLLDPAPLPAETGWCVLPDGVAYVAVRTAMPGVSAEMVDWWFDWHPDDPLRYRVWHPAAHDLEPRRAPGASRGAKRALGHRPPPRRGRRHRRACTRGSRSCAPSEIGFSTDALDDPRVATIVCG